MKYLLFISAVFLIKFAANGQSLHNIRIVHRGEETKPIGTLSIAVEKFIVPKDRRFDYIFGKTIKTDINSYNILANYINRNNYLNPGISKLSRSDEYYEIIVVSDTTEEKLFLVSSDFGPFFNPLKQLLKSNCNDKNLIAAFKYY